MAREYAQVRLAMWADDDIRALSPRAQHLYMVLLTAPSLSHCGVGDWRPGRIAALAAGWTTDAVEAAAAELIERLYIVVDEATEEVLVRSFVRHDGLMKQPKMATAMASAHGAVASGVLRKIIVHELKRLRDEFPDLKGWGSEKAVELLAKGSVDPSTYPLGKGSVKGSGKGSTEGSGNPKPTSPRKGSGKGSPTPAPTPTPTTSTYDSLRSSPSTAISLVDPPPPDDQIDAGTITAAWVDRYTALGTKPTTRLRGQVGQLARELLDAGNDPPLVLAAARQAAEKGFATIDRELGPMNGRRATATAEGEWGTAPWQHRDPATGRAFER